MLSWSFCPVCPFSDCSDSDSSESSVNFWTVFPMYFLDVFISRMSCSLSGAFSSGVFNQLCSGCSRESLLYSFSNSFRSTSARV